MNLVQMRSMLCCSVLITLTGCGRLIDWGSNVFYQGESVKQFSKIPRSYLRSLYLYDQFSTACIFDVLWLSDPVRTAYASAHAAKTGKGEEFRSNFLRRQLEENKHFITFYVLSDREKLDEKDADWSLFLRVNDQVYTPLDIKIIDIVPEYIPFFGRRYNTFKTLYAVKFNALTTEEKPILGSDVHQMALHVKSTFKEGMLVWPISGVK